MGSCCVSQGTCGLIHAAELFDPTRGYQFTTYAVHWIRKHVSRCVASHSRMIRLPARVHEKVVTMNRVKALLSASLGRDPSLEEVAQHVRVRLDPRKAADYEAAARRTAWTASLDASVGKACITLGSRKASLGELVVDCSSPQPEDLAGTAQVKDELAALLGDLPDLERSVIELRFGLKDGRRRSLVEVARELPELGTKKAVENCVSRALYKLRKPSTIAKMSDMKEAFFSQPR